MKILTTAGIALLFICCREATTTTTTVAPPTETTPAQPSCIPGTYTLCPADEGSRDATFVAFRERLKDALAEKDEAKLLALVDPKIRTSFGGDGGIATFKEQPERWTVLGKIINLGGTFRETSFWAPYVYSSWPDAVDPFEHVAAIRARVPIRERPAEDSKTLTRVDWAILRLEPSPDAPKSREWLRVRTADGHEGWVHADDVHSPVGYRAGFSKRSGEWKLEALVAGD